MQELALILLGSNQGNRLAEITSAIEKLKTHFGKFEKVSALYETSAWGKTDQPDFLNVVAGFYTSVKPSDLLNILLKTEKELGRERKEKWGERTIDIDLLYYGDHIINETELILPHPGIPERRFTLIPVCEIYPNFVHPLTGLTQLQLLTNCKDKGEVREFKEPV